MLLHIPFHCLPDSFQHDAMRDTGNTFSLLCAQRTEQSACRDEQDAPQLSLAQLPQQMPRQGHGAAAAAGAAAMGILLLPVIDQAAAVPMLRPNRNLFFFQ